MKIPAHRLTISWTVLVFLCLLCSPLLSACSPGHAGSDEIAFVRDGHLWTIDPTGTNAFEVVAGDTPIIGYAWSPDHHIFVFRLLDSDFAKTNAGKHLKSNPLTGLPGDEPSSLNTVGIDGGSPIPIAPSSAGILHSNAWWNPDGNRLLYREESAGSYHQATDATWWVSQSDQPDTIARKALPPSYSIPSLSSSGFLALGNNEQGVFTTTEAGTNFTFLMQGGLPGHPLPATMERLLWQPAHQKPAILYALPAPVQQHVGSITVQLLVREPHAQDRIIATCSCMQFAWSPDGKSILYTTGTRYTVQNLETANSFTFTAEADSVPYWSPDSQFLLLDGLHTLSLVQVASQRQQLLLSDATGMSRETNATLPSANSLLQPVENSLWIADSQHFAFVTRGRLGWNGQKLSGGNGLYMATINSAGQVQGVPTLVDSGNDSQAGWSYEDPNTSFLFS